MTVCVVTAASVVVTDMAQSVKVLNAVDQESRREPPFRDGLDLIHDDQSELVDLVDDAPSLETSLEDLRLY
jgi:hypothetical protein